jgi:GntR family transcriptional regulator, rspAB operon transcriptional repressor
MISMSTTRTGALLGTSADSARPIELNRQRPAADQVYLHLREAIIACRLLPNEPVSENRLCGMYGVSRSPVRIALTRLAEDGLIEIYPQRGSFVAPINLKQVREGQFARVALEVALIERAAARWSPEASTLARKEILVQKQHAKAGDAWLFYLDNERFHFAFAQQAGLPGVWTTVQVVKTLLDRIGHLANPVPGHMNRIILEHIAILDHLDAGDVDKAIAAMRAHINSVDVTIARLQPLHADYFVEG